ncbi:hypothetical protein [Pseudomonas fildesensis]|uniref:Uncharacterized protein n=1 Tax=Pseudomonas fildesensis TaxID=1674920 RepID=A0A0J8IPH8_9PSED|nr:hypothetical protein [Pseudomonas fildesensis]KMT53536.1 hypothetical protein ACR52_21535 [Pseudomonas fildesensis]
MQAITIKYLPATDTKDSRWKATAAAGSITVCYDHELTVEGNVKAAVKALVKKLGWNRADIWYVGGTANGHWVGVCASQSSPA